MRVGNDVTPCITKHETPSTHHLVAKDRMNASSAFSRAAICRLYAEQVWLGCALLWKKQNCARGQPKPHCEPRSNYHRKEAGVQPLGHTRPLSMTSWDAEGCLAAGFGISGIRCNAPAAETSTTLQHEQFPLPVGVVGSCLQEASVLLIVRAVHKLREAHI